MSYINRGSISAIGVIFPALAILFLGVRTYGWRHHSRVLAIDDILVVPAGALTIAAGVGLVIGTQMHIIGGHSDLDPASTAEETAKLGKFEYAFWMCHVLAIGFIKLTILFLLRGVFKGRAYRTVFDYVNWILITLVTLWTLVFLFFDIFACGTHPSASWESWESLREYCIDTLGMQTGGAVFSWVLDLAIFIEPLIMIRTLHMNSRRKIQTSLVFLCSGFAVIAGLLRMIPWIQLHRQDITHPTLRLLATTFLITDQQGIISIVLFWTYIEIGVGFIVSCIPRIAWIGDKISVDPILSKLRSLPSSVSLLRRDRHAHRRVEDLEQQSQSSWVSKLYIKTSSGHRSDDNVELSSTTERV
ncbi:uncharacterized protein GGS25DRAFT_504498 [Hypoxylon fragiforme]|uniref:uncharacterized protein n=1 Tax=Hypoxylon fragiforme TaxID=63214 RepID=UPI0020C6020B|nr:uncharacterized protein GGS25DRAFT_504498 [Hypoxylon fragiforme]KAI2605277.1 hypothetical protein GGS25DRAFT_504498 [Hypoxylon fragiforme]